MPDAVELLDEGIRAENLGITERALHAFQAAAEAATDPDVLAEALARQSHVLRRQARWEEAVQVARQAAQVAEAAGLPHRLAEAMNAEASVAMVRGTFDDAIPILERIIASTDDLKLRGIALQNLGSVRAQQGDLDAADAAFEESSRCFAAGGYDRGETVALNNLGRIALDRGDPARAESVLARAMDRARQLNDEELIATATSNYAEATLARGDHSRAIDLVAAALGHFRASGNAVREVECLRMLGTIEEQRGDIASAVRYYERGMELAQQFDARIEGATISSALKRLQAPS